MTHPLVYLSRLCRRWGGSLVLMPEPEFRALNFNARATNGLTQAPDDNHAIDWPNWKVLAVADRVNPGAVIHEMGHLFLAEGAPKTTDEPDWLGWEIVLARRAGCYRTWSKQNADYFIDDWNGQPGCDWDQFEPAQRRRLIIDRIAYAKKIGIVSRSGVPLCTRRD